MRRAKIIQVAAWKCVSCGAHGDCKWFLATLSAALILRVNEEHSKQSPNCVGPTLAMCYWPLRIVKWRVFGEVAA